MSNTQQDVIIYRDGFSSAQRQFEKDLRKRQRTGWKLVSVTPTHRKAFSGPTLTAIYERDVTPVYNPSLNQPGPSISYQQVPPPPPAEIPPSPLNVSEQTLPSPYYPTYPLGPTPPPPPDAGILPYSKTIFLGLIAAVAISFIFAVSGSENSLLSHFGASLFLGVIVSVLIMDWKGYWSMSGAINWRNKNEGERLMIGCLLFFIFPLVLFVYLILAGIKIFQTDGPLFSKQWDAPAPIKTRVKVGLVAGAIVALISVFTPASSPAGASADNASVGITPTATTTVVSNIITSKPSPAVTPKPSPTVRPVPTPKPAPTAVVYPQFDDGTYVVGKDIKPGTYRTRDASSGCYFARLKGFGGSVSDILANANTDAPAIVTISSTDQGFESHNCGTWTKDLSAITTSKTSFEDGMYIVGTDIQPGTYKSSGQSGCYFARLSDFGGTVDGILANDNTDTSAIVTISSTDTGFESHNCGTWTKE